LGTSSTASARPRSALRRATDTKQAGRAVERAFVETLMGLAEGASMGQVRAVAEYALEDLVRSQCRT
jgi:hypothetical protein